ncbi:hypothetical protein DdX_15387 [Ditylenchus destructor]|uniref:Uncharacterized protein n=1 Tax=Ditylenchus destructor TaxID=166010 RepID=A0AAD4MQZ8_9BILA|nr:hypothetical protein DdX_15387 [Ditylenchus destructor]
MDANFSAEKFGKAMCSMNSDECSREACFKELKAEMGENFNKLREKILADPTMYAKFVDYVVNECPEHEALIRENQRIFHNYLLSQRY